MQCEQGRKQIPVTTWRNLGSKNPLEDKKAELRLKNWQIFTFFNQASLLDHLAVHSDLQIALTPLKS